MISKRHVLGIIIRIFAVLAFKGRTILWQSSRLCNGFHGLSGDNAGKPEAVTDPRENRKGVVIAIIRDVDSQPFPLALNSHLCVWMNVTAHRDPPFPSLSRLIAALTPPLPLI